MKRYSCLFAVVLALVFVLSVAFFREAEGQGTGPSPPVQTEHFRTKAGGFEVDAQSRTVSYMLALEIIKPFAREMFAQIIFENPADKTKPFFVERVISPADEELVIKDIFVTNTREGIDYQVVVLVYADEKKSELATKHPQKIRAIFREQHIGDLQEAIDHILSGDIQTGREMLEFNLLLSAGMNFMVRVSLEVLEDFCDENLSREYLLSFFRALSYSLARDHEACLREAKKTVEIKKDYPYAYMYLGSSLLSPGEYKEAAKAFEVLLAMKPDMPEALWGLGESYLKMGKNNKAKQYFKEALGFFEKENNQMGTQGVYKKLESLQ